MICGAEGHDQLVGGNFLAQLSSGCTHLPLQLRSLHALVALALAAIAQPNMAAASRHHFCLNDGVLIRMRCAIGRAAAVIRALA
jgi:cytochrome b561